MLACVVRQWFERAIAAQIQISTCTVNTIQHLLVSFTFPTVALKRAATWMLKHQGGVVHVLLWTPFMIEGHVFAWSTLVYTTVW